MADDSSYFRRRHRGVCRAHDSWARGRLRPWAVVRDCGGAALGACAGGVLVAFGSFVFWGSRTRFYANQLQHGNFIVTVKYPARKEEAIAVLAQDGAHV